MGGRTNQFSRQGPLVSGVLALLAALFVLPSALNVQQANPNQTLEFAPVPPSDEDAPPPDAGNVSSLSLGSSSQGASAAAGPDVGSPGLPPLPTDGVGARPVTKRCVGSPPRQTEDPLAPPCVAHFEGDNGGATAPGVDHEEIRVVWYLGDQTGQGGTSRGTEFREDGVQFVDLDDPPTNDDYLWPRMLRLYQRYFNDRFQTYGRRVHFWVQFGPSKTPEDRRADASAVLDEIDPFAVVMGPVVTGNLLDYVEPIVSQGRLVLLSSDGFSESGMSQDIYARHPGQVWSVNPSLELRSELASDWMCTQIVGNPVSFSGNAGENGEPRRYGLLYPVREGRQDYADLASFTRERLEACGIEFEVVVTYNPGTPEMQQAIAEDVAQLLQAGVTTVVAPGGQTTFHTNHAATLGYRPEWVLGGDGLLETTMQGQLANQTVWQHARVASTYTLRRPVNQRTCVRAAFEVNPAASRLDVSQFACRMYPEMMLLYTGIQVAGANLSRANVDRGFHAIPPGPSGDPAVPACFFLVGDYTCAKDASVAHWDPAGMNTNGTSGCWRMVNGGRRHLVGTWPDGDIEDHTSPDDPCSIFMFHPTPDP